MLTERTYLLLADVLYGKDTRLTIIDYVESAQKGSTAFRPIHLLAPLPLPLPLQPPSSPVSAFPVLGVRFRVSGSRFPVPGFRFRVSGSQLKGPGCFRGSDSGSRSRFRSRYVPRLASPCPSPRHADGLAKLVRWRQPFDCRPGNALALSRRMMIDVRCVLTMSARARGPRCVIENVVLISLYCLANR